MNFKSYQEKRLERIEQYLNDRLTPPVTASEGTLRLYEALQYATLGGGKRIRPLLVYATGEALGNPLELLDAPAAAVELIHCYSLIHDDLPAMDNDDFRRGKSSCHKAFDEATAILAGDALHTLAFQILSDAILNPILPEHKIDMIQTLSEKAGISGMIGGQALDLAAEKSLSFMTIGDLKDMHQKKTGALIEACVILGALASATKIDRVPILKLQDFARCMGLAFQIQDDVLDVAGDLKQNKITFPSKLGLETAKQYAKTLHSQALASITFLNEKSAYLSHISDLFVNRAS